MIPIEEIRHFYDEQKGRPQISLIKSEDLHQIVFVRHGEPEVEIRRWYRRNQFQEYDLNYKNSSVRGFELSPLDLRSVENALIYHSALRRAEHTAELIFGNKFPMISDDRFREFERGVTYSLGLALPLRFWKTVSRGLWFAGISPGDIESIKQAKERAKDNASFLADKSQRHRTIIVVAHGWHNRYVTKNLKSLGWNKVADTGNGFLSIKIMAKAGNP